MLKVTIQPLPVQDTGRYPTYYAVDTGSVKVGPAGELTLVASREEGYPTEFRIYAPGTWKEVNIEPVAGE